MKRVMLTVTVLIVIVFALLTYAQQNYVVRADIPFEFQVNSNTLPPGQYDFCWDRKFVAAVKLANRSTNSTIPVVHYATIRDIEQPSKDTKAVVVFHHLGGMYFLSGIRQPDTGVVTLTLTAREKNMQRLAMKTVEVEAASGK